jgi:hypothetical protein
MAPYLRGERGVEIEGWAKTRDVTCRPAGFFSFIAGVRLLLRFLQWIHVHSWPWAFFMQQAYQGLDFYRSALVALSLLALDQEVAKRKNLGPGPRTQILVVHPSSSFTCP